MFTIGELHDQEWYGNSRDRPRYEATDVTTQLLIALTLITIVLCWEQGPVLWWPPWPGKLTERA